MATAEDLRHELEQYLEQHEVKFTIKNESDNVVKLTYRMNPDEKVITIYIDFDEEGDSANSAHIFCNLVGTPREDCKSKALIACNEWNRKKRWVKTYLGGDGDIWCDLDAILAPGTVGTEVLELVERTVDLTHKFRVEYADILASNASMEDQVAALMRLLSQMQADQSE